MLVLHNSESGMFFLYTPLSVKGVLFVVSHKRETHHLHLTTRTQIKYLCISTQCSWNWAIILYYIFTLSTCSKVEVFHRTTFLWKVILSRWAMKGQGVLNSEPFWLWPKTKWRINIFFLWQCFTGAHLNFLHYVIYHHHKWHFPKYLSTLSVIDGWWSCVIGSENKKLTAKLNPQVSTQPCFAWLVNLHVHDRTLLF